MNPQVPSPTTLNGFRFNFENSLPHLSEQPWKIGVPLLDSPCMPPQKKALLIKRVTHVASSIQVTGLWLLKEVVVQK